MPTTIVKFMTSTTTITGPTVTATEYAVQGTNTCKAQTLPKPQDWSLIGWCIVIVPTLILLCSFMKNLFAVGVPGSENAKMGVERLCTSVVAFLGRKRAEEQQKLEDEKSEDNKVTNVIGNRMRLGC